MFQRGKERVLIKKTWRDDLSDGLCISSLLLLVAGVGDRPWMDLGIKRIMFHVFIKLKIPILFKDSTDT